ncbi:hypothetical protein GCM10011416_01410 [Polaribacter pacificus]|uniref:Uncharacterized protein n=1 Tax=Polaribacter pacificus TaxID=1775173 RepID=A0A917HSC0_9FLAO|nr:hypothetical protein [Polaribacter pacificus]GGG88792.1 hypothetical protein GCM10011416_01410 [Polaribacter pacificus]
MKKYIHKKAVIVAVTILGIIGCTEFVDKIDDFKIGIASTIFDQNGIIQITDYNGNQSDISNTNFNITLSGADADKLVSEAGELDITANQGYIQLNVNPNKSQGVKELNFNLTISGGTYRTATFPITLKDSTSFIQVQMVNEANMVGTDKASGTANLTNNATSAAVTVTTTKAKSTNTSSVTVDTGTQFKDASGAVISGSDVKIALTNVDDLGETLDPIYSGAKEFKDANGAVITNKIPVLNGRTNIVMEVGTKQVKQFDKPITVAITIPSSSKNPATGNTVQIGDTYPIYTNEEGSETWTYHGTGTVAAGSDANTYKVQFTTTHLSNYTLVSFVDKPDCGEFSFDITAPNAAADFSGTFYLHFSYIGPHGTYAQGLSTISVANKVVSLSNISRTTNFLNSGKFTKADILNLIAGERVNFYKLLIYGKGKNNDLSSQIATLANCELAINMSTLAANNPDEKNINIDVAANCDGNTLVPDGFPIYVERADGSFSYEGTIKNGKLTLHGFELNKEYNFKSFYKGKSYTHKWTFTSTSYVDKNFSIPDNLCSEIGF